MRLMSVAVHWSTSDVRPMQLCYNEPVKCALEGCNAILCMHEMYKHNEIMHYRYDTVLSSAEALCDTF